MVVAATRLTQRKLRFRTNSSITLFITTPMSIAEMIMGSMVNDIASGRYLTTRKQTVAVADTTRLMAQQNQLL